MQLGKKVLVIDLDQQQNASRTLGYIKDGKLTVAELIYNAVADIDTNLSDVIRHNESGIDYIPSSPMLTNITSTMANDEDSNYILRRILSNDVFAEYDYILLDCRTLLDLLASNAMNASNYVIIPVESGIYAYEGLDKMLNKVASVNNSTNRDLRVLRGVRCAELRRSGGFAHRVVPQTGVRRKNGKNEKMSLTNAGGFCIITPAMDS